VEARSTVTARDNESTRAKKIVSGSQEKGLTKKGVGVGRKPDHTYGRADMTVSLEHHHYSPFGDGERPGTSPLLPFDDGNLPLSPFANGGNWPAVTVKTVW
jgi:hypothetical protein